MANELTVQDITNMSVAFAKSGLFCYKSSAEAFSLMMVAQANGILTFRIMDDTPALEVVKNVAICFKRI